MSRDVTALLLDARRSLRALALEVPAAVWDDANEKIGGALDELAAENAEYETCANLMLDGLLLIRDEAGKPLGIGDAVADQGWCAGVAMSAIAAVHERGEAWKRRDSHVPRFLPRWLGGEADRVSGPGWKAVTQPNSTALESPRPELRASAAEAIGREGMVTIWDDQGRYLGCMGVELWKHLLTVRDA